MSIGNAGDVFSVFGDSVLGVGSYVAQPLAMGHSAHAVLPSSHPSAGTWCKPLCVPEMDQVFPYGGSAYIRIPDRPWEALRYRLLEYLLTWPENRSWRQLVELWESLQHEWPLAIFASITTDEARECPWGRLLMLLTEAASRGVSEAEVPAAAFAAASREMFAAPHVMNTAFCAGWPIYGLLDRALEPSALLSHDHLSLRVRFFEFGFSSSKAPEEMVSFLNAAFEACAYEAPEEDCMVASRPLLRTLHDAQSKALFGRGVCPQGSIAVWLDHMEPAPIYPLCLNAYRNNIDDQLKRKGRHAEAAEIANLLSFQGFGDPGCRVLDVGANVGAITTMLALMGYRIVAAEPLPRNADLLEATLRLNGLAQVPFPGRQINAGEVSVLRMAIGEKAGEKIIFEGRGNAGDSQILAREACHNETHLCQGAVMTPVARLDDLFHYGDEPFCFMKIDVQGYEPQVLKGAMGLLDAKFIRTIYFEWRPNITLSRGEDPAVALWLLHSLDYRLMVPKSWFEFDPTGVNWVSAGPEHFRDFCFPQVKGNIIAHYSP